MSDSQFAAPVLIGADGTESELPRLSLQTGSNEAEYDEAWLQNLLFRHPASLPIAELDRSYLGLIPICCELNTPAGPIDVLYATPSGKLALVEVKLWRNPEARRKVVGQILDYAKELSKWSYEDLQREVSKATNQHGNALFELVRGNAPEVDESAFVDEVSRSLRTGRFMLLIVGDGIREGVGSIANFLEEFANLQFSFGLVEVAIFNLPGGGRLVQPRVLARTLTVKRSVIELAADNLVIREDGDEIEAEVLTDAQRFSLDFFTEFLRDLKLDDVSQPMAKPTRAGHITFPMVPPSQSWITVYFLRAGRRVGVFLTVARGAYADLVYAKLTEEQDEILKELGVSVSWTCTDGKPEICSTLSLPGDPYSPKYRAQIKEFFVDRVNRFVNTFRPRLERIYEETRQ